jgi:hypothetical protein
MPIDYYERIEMIQKVLRQKDHKSAYSSASLIPIPGHQFYSELVKKHHNNNETFKQELQVTLILINRIINRLLKANKICLAPQ